MPRAGGAGQKKLAGQGNQVGSMQRLEEAEKRGNFHQPSQILGRRAVRSRDSDLLTADFTHIQQALTFSSRVELVIRSLL